jgi:hypothetical protein
MRIPTFSLVIALAGSSYGLGQEPPDTNYDESKMPKYEADRYLGKQ